MFTKYTDKTTGLENTCLLHLSTIIHTQLISYQTNEHLGHFLENQVNYLTHVKFSRTDASGLQEAWLGDWWYQLWGTKRATTGNQLGSC